MSLPYTYELVKDPHGGWFIAVKELPGCMSQGEDIEEAYKMIEDAKSSWLEVALEDGMDIPEPRSDEAFSGKFVIRMPHSLHRALVEKAQAEGVSLNQYVTVALAQNLGHSALKAR